MARKRGAATKATAKKRLNLSLDAKLYSRLSAFVSYNDRTASDVVTEAVEALMRAKAFRVGQGGDDAAEGPAEGPPPAPAEAGGKSRRAG